MLFIGLDPGFSGAWGMIDHNGKYWSCGDMINDGKHLNHEEIWAEISQARDRQDCQVVIEAVHAMPGQGVSSSFKFGMAFGGAISIAQRLKCPWHLVTPHKWKKDMDLTWDKDKSLDMARQTWPNAPLTRKKDNGRAEALLMAEWLRKSFN